MILGGRVQQTRVVPRQPIQPSTRQKPTIALNHPEARGETTLPAQMMVIGLSIEDEARQAADWAAREQPGAIAYILSNQAQYQRRSASAFAAQWQRLGRSAKTAEMMVLNGYLSDGELVALRARLQGEPSALVFAALDPDQARQLRVSLQSPPSSVWAVSRWWLGVAAREL
eukprot:gene3605-4633_t